MYYSRGNIIHTVFYPVHIWVSNFRVQDSLKEGSRYQLHISQYLLSRMRVLRYLHVCVYSFQTTNGWVLHKTGSLARNQRRPPHPPPRYATQMTSQQTNVDKCLQNRRLIDVVNEHFQANFAGIEGSSSINIT